ncbi:hypothetical protein PP175_09210 [Aneurinibacillus sp. Ricciae_BoGa-3]|uniref:YphA family membrane protein n=1 Tax=Aneurinibacillus sp. Ricciae_BoGa-3 TaxID=3022697 RepID=UPI002340551A|nr:hypothetical protein [Aneurinibacillus sp. Ricciae_BoGa-3]WCK56065.1 hypothetical protein PP175_09210 [Aneurinibacillus sp. Ricciae_BoGa-3]
MNPGYIASLCLFILFVLYWMGSLEAVRKSARKVIVGFTAALVSGAWDIPVRPSLSINLSFLVAGFLFFYLWSREAANQRTQIFMAGLLVGTSLFLVRYLLYLDPVLQIADLLYCQVAVSLALTVTLARTLPEAILISTFGTLAFEVFNEVWQYTLFGSAALGGMAFLDSLILSTLVSAVGKAFILSLYDHAFSMYKGWLNFKKEKRAGR